MSCRGTLFCCFYQFYVIFAVFGIFSDYKLYGRSPPLLRLRLLASNSSLHTTEVIHKKVSIQKSNLVILQSFNRCSICVEDVITWMARGQKKRKMLWMTDKLKYLWMSNSKFVNKIRKAVWKQPPLPVKKILQGSKYCVSGELLQYDKKSLGGTDLTINARKNC